LPSGLGRSLRGPRCKAQHPVINVSWDDAKSYVAWLSGKTGKPYRLLSEAEREYVTRAGTTAPFWWGSFITPGLARYKDSGDSRTVDVDRFGHNPWGLYGVHGNVWEWTEDCWSETNSGNPGDGSARSTGNCNSRMVRGGSWTSVPMSLRSASRSAYSASFRLDIVGFRVARTLAQ
jgi:formylglycine-generating enzyme required for sulfatase activity